MPRCVLAFALLTVHCALARSQIRDIEHAPQYALASQAILRSTAASDDLRWLSDANVSEESEIFAPHVRNVLFPQQNHPKDSNLRKGFIQKQTVSGHRKFSRNILQDHQTEPEGSKVLSELTHANSSVQDRTPVSYENDSAHAIEAKIGSKPGGSSSTAILDPEGSVLVFRHSDFESDTPICQIQGICRVGDGSYLLPKWMERHKATLNRCGISRTHFVLSRPHAGDENETSSERWDIEPNLRQKITLTYNQSKEDLFGGDAPREKPYFLTADMVVNLALMSVFSPTDVESPMNQMELGDCFLRDHRKCTDAKFSPTLHPMLLIGASISEKPAFHWEQGFLRLVRDGHLGALHIWDMHDLYQWRFRSQAACIRSLTTTAASISNIPAKLFAPTNILYRHKAFNRYSIFDRKHGLQERAPNSKSKGFSQCVVKILILNKYGKRHIVGDDALRESIEAYSGAAREMHPYLELLPEIATFDNSSFHEQALVMQESSITIGAYGKSNTNIIFQRPNSTFFEILPFGVSSSIHAELARLAGVEFKSVTAQPDEEVFQSCVQHYGMQSDESRKVLGDWKAAAQKFREQTKATGANPRSNYVLNGMPRLTERVARRLRYCALHQRLSFNVRHVAKLVTEKGIRMCQIMQDSTVSST